MKVLITGSQGFIGQYICDELLANNYCVVGVDNFQKYGHLTRQHDSHNLFKLYELDLLSQNLFEIIEIEKPDVIIANAAVIGGLEYINKYPYSLFSMNEKILLNTLESAVKFHATYGLKRFIYMSSSYVFQNVAKENFTEADLSSCPYPESPYAFQKLAGEVLVKAAQEETGIPYTIVRPFNCIGVGEEVLQKVNMFSEIKSSHVLTDFIKKIKSGEKPLKIWGSGNQTRTFTNCSDVAHVIRLIIESQESVNEDFNVCGDQAITILDLAKYVWSILRSDEFEFISENPKKHDVQNRKSSNSKLKNILNFKIKKNIFESIDSIVKGKKNEL